MATEGVKAMIEYMTNNPVLSGAPTIHQLTWLDDMELTKPEARNQKDPFIVVAELTFEDGKRDDSLQYFKNNIVSAQDETGIFVYGMSKKDDAPNMLYTVEAYESEQYLWDVHVKTKAVEDTIAKTKDMRKELKLNKLKLHGGYMCRQA